MTEAQAITAPDTGQEDGMPHGSLSSLAALAALKPHVRRVDGVTLQEVADTSAPSKIVDGAAVNVEVDEEDADLVAWIRALEIADLAEGEVVEVESPDLLVTVEAAAKPGETAKPRFTPPKAPEGVSRDIGALFRSNVMLGKYWFYIVDGEKKCGTATLKVVSSRAGLNVLVIGVEGEVPEYLRDLRMAGIPIELAGLVHPESFGGDELAQKARQLGLELARIRNRMSRAHSRNRRNGNTAKQETQS